MFCLSAGSVVGVPARSEVLPTASGLGRRPFVQSLIYGPPFGCCPGPGHVPDDTLHLFSRLNSGLSAGKATKRSPRNGEA